jgi:serine/threonine-protein kinase
MICYLGRYEIIEELGQGAMGVVYKAKDPLIDRVVALKCINLDGLDKTQRAEYEERFYREAKAAGRLNHTNIVTIYDLGECGEVAYIAMELMEGRELQNILADSKRLRIEEMLDIGTQIADGLAFAHNHGIIHRDIKPSNIMVLSNNHIKIADFGIAQLDSSLHLTQAGMIMGSPLYMSPEQILGNPITSQSDIFALGSVLYKLLTGRTPFFGENTNAVMYQIVNEMPPKPSSLNPDISNGLDKIIYKCLEKKLEDRYQNATELANDLRSLRKKLLQNNDSLDDRFMIGEHLKRFAIPGGLSQKWVEIGSYLAILFIFIIDQITDSTIQLHMLYLFPLIMISFHSEKEKLVRAAMVFSLVLQGVNLMLESTLPMFSKIILTSLIVPTNVVIVYIARIARANFLEVGHLASFDGLTGLHNRLSLESITEKEIERQKSKGGVFSFVVFDIDNFKEFNNSRGFKVGDQALKLLARTLQENTRQFDTIARISGDKFAILMPNTSASICESLCNRLSEKITNRMNEAHFTIATIVQHETFEQPPESTLAVFNRVDNLINKTD